MLEMSSMVLEKVEAFALLVEQKSALEKKLSTAKLRRDINMIKVYQSQLDGVSKKLDLVMVGLDNYQCVCG